MGRSEETPPLSRTASWGEPRTASACPPTQTIQSSQRSALDSSDEDEESFVNVLPDNESSTPSPLIGHARDVTVPCSASLVAWRAEGSRSVERSAVQIGTSLSAGSTAPSAVDQQPQAGSITDAIVRGPSPFRALMIHTNAIWRTDYDPLYTGHIEDGYTIPLFDSSTIREDPDHIASLDEFSRMCYRHDRHHYFVDLFFQMRYHSGHKKRDKRASPTSLMKAWEAFVYGYRQSPSFWMHRFQKERERAYKHTTEGAKLNVHRQTIAAGFPCGVRADEDCPFCYPDSPKLPNKARFQDTLRYLIPKELRLLMIQLDSRCLDDATDAKEAEEFIADEDALSGGFFEADSSLRVQHQVAAANLEIHRMKRQNLSLAKEFKDLKKHCDEIKQQHQEEHTALVDIVQELSDKIKSGDISERKRRT